MKQADFESLVEGTLASCQQLLIGKGEEYAGSHDRLANFKRGAQLTGCTPMQVGLIYLSKHYDSLSTFIKKDAMGIPLEAQGLSEHIHGRIDDLINYCLLMKALVEDTRFRPLSTDD